ncbi:hypothetical protein HELRODRAFT_164082 [Helobdella robusta]|uniref:EF-hand domain-containing protein n=1 Tax=Helobdella robusta TaxID=6412 RepID=T1EUW4_HELRO|nr:hypothetical protein HELRODRAFT_164082 [Helobdella robusta]ESN94274.1 hypothetical protein HELRODRAFT_164082 [Helobdella robusta]
MLNEENVERVAVLISCGEKEQLIGVPQLENGAGSTIAKSVYSELGKWGALYKIQAMSFDTTAVNSGRIKENIVFAAHGAFHHARTELRRYLKRNVDLDNFMAVFLSKEETLDGILPNDFHQLKQMFLLIDANGDGVISLEEIDNTSIKDYVERYFTSHTKLTDDYTYHINIKHAVESNSDTLIVLCPAKQHEFTGRNLRTFLLSSVMLDVSVVEYVKFLVT